MPGDCTWPLPFKHPQSTDPVWQLLVPQLTTDGGADVPARCKPAVERLGSLRKQLATALSSKGHASGPHEQFVDTVVKPYAALVGQAQLHFPLSGGKVPKLKYAWHNMWEGTKQVSESVSLEIAGALVNLAAAHSATGSKCVADGQVADFKGGFQAFQQCAGVFAYLQAAGVPEKLAGTENCGDLSADCLQFCEHVALANAHHCSVLKAEAEMPSKHPLLAKLCVDGSKAYADVAQLPMGFAPAGKCASLASLVEHARAAAAVLEARAGIHLAQHHLPLDEAGVAVARGQAAIAKLAEARGGIGKKNAHLAQWLDEELRAAQTVHQKSVHRNETVYFDKIPAGLTLDGTGRTMGKPTALPPLQQLDGENQDAFAGVVPTHVVKIAGEFRREMAELMSKKQHEVLRHRQRSSEMMSQLAVEGTIASLTRSQQTAGRVPEALRKRIVTLRESMPAGTSCVTRVVTLVAHTHQVGESVEATVAEAGALLDEEKAHDEAQCVKYTPRVWRPLCKASCDLTDVTQVRAAIAEVRSDCAKKLNAPLGQIKTILEENATDLSRLDWPLEDLDALMPFTKSDAALAAQADVAETVQRLQTILVRYEQTEVVESAQFKELQTLLMSNRAMNALAAGDESDHGRILEEIQTEVADRIDVIGTAMRSREDLVKEAERSMGFLAEKQSTDPVAAEIQGVCTQLEKTISMFNEVTAELSELALVGASLLERADMARRTARSVLYGRKLEAEELGDQIDRDVEERMNDLKAKQIASQAEKESRARQEELRAQIAALEAERQANIARSQAPAPQVQSPIAGGAPGPGAPGAPAMYAPPAYAPPAPQRAPAPQQPMQGPPDHFFAQQHQQHVPQVQPMQYGQTAPVAPPPSYPPPPQPQQPQQNPPPPSYDAFFQ